MNPTTGQETRIGDLTSEVRALCSLGMRLLGGDEQMFWIDTSTGQLTPITEIMPIPGRFRPHAGR